MNSSLLLALGIMLTGLATTAEIAPDQLVNSERWSANSSGKLTKTFDVRENALRFDVTFPSSGDRWVYPAFKLRGATESLKNVQSVEFEWRAESDGQAANCKFALFMLTPKGRLSVPIPTLEWQKVHLELAPLSAGPAATDFRIGLNPLGAKLTYQIRNIRFSYLQQTTIQNLSELRCDAPGNVFTDRTAPRFTLTHKIAGRMNYRIRDWQNQPLTDGIWDGATTPTLELKPLPPGYYTLNLSGVSGSVPFTVVIDPAKRTYNPDSFFAMDTAQSWLASPRANNPGQPANGYEIAVGLARLAGLTMIRDRMRWSEVEPTPNEYRWGKYMTTAKLSAEKGIRIATTFHDVPRWSRQTGILPDDLFTVYRFSRTAGKNFSGMITAWEFWNEPDVGFGGLTAWNFAAAHKAVYLGFKSGNPEAAVLLGSLSSFPAAAFADGILKNDLNHYIDVFNYHVYESFSRYPSCLDEIRNLMKKYRLTDKPIWITENGSRYEGHGRLDTVVPGYKDHDPDQERMLVEFVPKSQILMQAQGVARDFFFVLLPHNEDLYRKAWGLLRWDFTAKPAYAAFANLTYQLANARYLGTYDPAPDVKGFLYEQPDGNQTLAFWVESELDRTTSGNPLSVSGDKREKKIVIGLPDRADSSRAIKLSDVMGKTSVIRPENGTLAVTGSRYPAYLSGLGGLKATHPAPPVVRSGNRPGTSISPIVLDVKLQDSFRIPGKTFAVLKENPGRISIKAYNFDRIPQSGTLKFLGEGKLHGLPESVTIPPYGTVKFDARYEPSSSSTSPFSALCLGGTFNGKPVSRVYIPILHREMPYKTFDFNNPARWRHNSSGAMQVTFDQQEKALKFTVKFDSGKDLWVYPEYLIDPATENLQGAAGISFEVKAEQKNGSRKYRCAKVMAAMDSRHENSKSICFDYHQVPSPEWHTETILFENLTPEHIRQLKIGMNPTATELTYYIRNFKVYFTR